jgi:transcriptional regulator with XRE-family HTH domain
MTQLEKIMESSGLTQKTLARITGLSQGRISLLLRGLVEPSDREETAFLEYFDLPACVLLSRADEV